MNFSSRNGQRQGSNRTSAQRIWRNTPLFRYATAFCLVAITWGIRAALDRYLGSMQPFILFLAPVLVMGWWFGRGPASLAAALGWLLGAYFFSYPRHALFISNRAHEVAVSLVYLVLSIAIICMTHRFRRGREQLREGQERFRLFMDHTPSLAWVKDEQGRYVFLNKTYGQRFHVRLADCLGKTDEQLWDSDTATRLRQADQQALGASRPVEIIEKVTEPSGRTSYWHNTKFSFQDNSGHRFVASLGLDITEGKQAEEKLRASEERLRKAMSTPTVGVLFFNLDGRMDDANSAFERMSGYAAEELRHFHWKALTAPESWDITARHAGQLASRGETDPYEKEMVRKDGSRWWGLFAPVLLAGSGANAECMEFIVDITDRRQAEEALRRSEALYRTMARNIPDGAMSVVDRSLRYLTAEGDLLARLELSKEIIEGRTVPDAFPGEVGRTRAEHFRQALSGQVTRYETEYHGRTIWSQLVPLRDERGEVFAAMSLALDITERKHAERTLQRRTLHLYLLHQATAGLLLGQQPVDLLRQLFPQIAEAFTADAFILYRVEPSTGCLHLQACAGIGEHEQHKLESFRSGCAICTKAAEALHRPIIATHIQDQEAPSRSFVRSLGFRSYLYYPLCVNGRLHGTLAFASRQRDEYDSIDLDFFQTIARTLAEALERRRLETELQRHAANLEKTVQERTIKLRETIADLEGFSYSLIHDMRAPLRAMQGYATVLEDRSGLALKPSERDLLRRISSAATRMDQLITDSLNYTRILREDLPLGRVNLGELLRGIVETYPNLHPPQADVILELGDVFGRGNQAVLTQIFSNLLGNSVKFVAPAVHPRVRVWAETAGPVRPGEEPSLQTGTPPLSTVRIFIQDNGIGIPKDAYESIFGMFQRLHRVDEYPGTGIGLALVKKSLERIGGRISLQSELGHGSRFCVELPSERPL